VSTSGLILFTLRPHTDTVLVRVTDLLMLQNEGVKQRFDLLVTPGEWIRVMQTLQLSAGIAAKCRQSKETAQ
jgi:hypothetical protein